MVSPLNGAVSLVEVDDITKFIAWGKRKREGGEDMREGGTKKTVIQSRA